MVRADKSLFGGVFGESLAEFFGTMVLILFGCGSVASFALFGAPSQSWLLINIGWGLAVMLGVYVAGTISGAHLNPAVTLGLAATGRFSWSKTIPYIIAQVLGAFVAAGIIFFVYRGAIDHALAGKALSADNVSTVNVWYTGPAEKFGIDYVGAFGMEFLASALLVGLILAITDGRNSPVTNGMNPFIIGFLIVAIGISFGLTSGYAINPARDFGPRLWATIVGGGSGSMNAYAWIPIVAPILGGIVGAFVFDLTIGRTLEARKIEHAETPEGETHTEPPKE